MVKKLFKKIKSYFPQRLPVGVTAFNFWADEIIVLAKCPNNDSFKFALATMIINLGPTRNKAPKNYFVKALQAGMAKQVASGIMYDLKEKQKAEELKAKIKAEDTAAKLTVVSSNEPAKQ